MFDASAYEVVMIVHELHQWGYEQLRLLPGMSPSGCSWRWAIYPKVLMKDSNQCERHDCLPFYCPYGSTGAAFPTEGQGMKTANDFMREFESIVNLGEGEDKEYVEWFKQIVEHAKNYDFPIAYEDHFEAEQWKFVKGDALRYPPFTSISADSLSDEKMVDLARCVFDEGSVKELNEIMFCEGNKSSIHEIAEVIRMALREKKCLFCHYNVYEGFSELFAVDDEAANKIMW